MDAKLYRLRSVGYSTLDDAMAANVTREQARLEIRKHGCSWPEFVREAGDRPAYSGRIVLGWLGY